MTASHSYLMFVRATRLAVNLFARLLSSPQPARIAARSPGMSRARSGFPRSPPH
jgi:hypothetical protein